MKKSYPYISYINIIPQLDPHHSATIYGNKKGLWKLCWSLFKYLLFSSRKYEEYGFFYNVDNEGFNLELSTNISSSNLFYIDEALERELAARQNSYATDAARYEAERAEMERIEILNKLLKDTTDYDHFK